jgi:hypothetical protein
MRGALGRSRCDGMGRIGACAAVSWDPGQRYPRKNDRDGQVLLYALSMVGMWAFPLV